MTATASAPAQTSAAAPATKVWLVLFTCALSMFAGNLVTIPVSVIMPTIAKTFAVELPTAQWAITGHFVALAATMLPVGSIGDLVGRQRVLMAGFAILLASLAATPLSGNLEFFVFLRVIQGVGAGMVSVTVPAIATAALPPSQRGKALGITFLGSYLANGIGQPTYGALVQFAPWFAPFLVAIIPTVLAFALATRLPAVKRPDARPFDAVGATLLMFGFGGLVVGAGHGQEAGWEFQHTLVHVAPLVLVSAGALATYVYHARRTRYPILPLDLFRSVTFTTGAITNSLAHMTMLMVGFLMPFYLQNALGYSPLSVALFLVPMSIAMNLVAIPSGWAYDRWGSRLPCASAMLLGAVLLFSYQGLSADSGMIDVMGRMVLAGLSLGLFITPNVSAIMGTVRSDQLAMAAGFEQTTRNLGHSVGSVLASGVATFVLGSATAKATPETYVQVVQGAGLLAGALMFGGALLALMRDDSRGPSKPAREVEVRVSEPATQTA